jgi:ADP-dependent NAD(P)H-hydrate dehydratase / NAD(P)H-hydrate epimerase
MQIEFSKFHHVYVILKGAHTCITTPAGEAYFNSTGNPGMAKGGSGDVLTGILTGLLAQGYSPLEACLLGVYLHGLAGDLAAESLGIDGMIATDIINSIPKAWMKLRESESAL